MLRNFLSVKHYVVKMLSVLLLLPFLLITGCESTNESGFTAEKPSDVADSIDSTGGSTDNLVIQGYSSAIQSALFKDQLVNDEQKKLYAAFEYMMSTDTTSLHSLSDEAKITDNDIIYSGKDNALVWCSNDEYRKNSKAITEKLQEDLRCALIAFVYDHPQYYWLTEYYQGSIFADDDDIYIAVRVNYWEGLSSDKYSDFIGSVNKYYDSCVTDEMSTYQKISRFNSALCDTIHYTVIDKSDVEQTSLDVFISSSDGSKSISEAVCEGYAEAFKILCDKAKIPCMVVVGIVDYNTKTENHAWNIVQMDDNKWYLVDVTNNDNDIRQISSNATYLLVGRRVMLNNWDAGQLMLTDGGQQAFPFCWPMPEVDSYTK